MKIYLAKTINRSTPGHTVYMHCKLSGLVAGELLKRFPAWVLDRILGAGNDPARICFGVSSHDVGKITLVFQIKILGNCHRDPRVDTGLLAYARSIGLTAKDDRGHDLASMLAIEPFDLPWSKIAGSHHGRKRDGKGAELVDECFDGDPENQPRDFNKDRVLLLKMLARTFGLGNEVDVGGERFPFSIVKDSTAERFLRGLTATSDWIASGDYLNRDPLLKEGRVPWARQVRNAVTEAGLHRPTLKTRPDGSKPSFKEIFGFDPYDSQLHLIRAVIGMRGPGVAVLEEVMGRGKTEAALYSGLAAMHDTECPATGIAFLMPTKATSDALFRKRISKFVRRVVKGRQAWTKLAHQDARLYDTSSADKKLFNSWFDSGKKQLLHNFVVGTVDQAMMSVVNVKHAAVRSYALAGKVVFIDEVHSYDAYMMSLVGLMVKHLVDLGCRVVLLSATLTANVRSALLGAPSVDMRYPLVSCRRADSASVTHSHPKPPPSRLVDLTVLQDQDYVIKEVVSAYMAGGKVLCIFNTVSECQDFADIIESHIAPAKVQVVHAKFVRGHRALVEEALEVEYGKDSSRGVGAVTVTTQVAEQSLDIDSDLLVTALCPMDLLLQRTGRLYRHDRSVRPLGPVGRCIVLLPIGCPPNAKDISEHDCFGVSRFVYSSYVLARTLVVLNGFLSAGGKRLSLPGDIRDLVEGTYRDRGVESNGTLEDMRIKKEERTKELDALALCATAMDTPPEGDVLVSTRFVEDQTRRIILLRGMQRTAGGYLLNTIFGDRVSLYPSMGKEERVAAARLLQKSMVQDSMRKAPERPTRPIQALDGVLPMSEQVALVRVAANGQLHYFKLLNGNDGGILVGTGGFSNAPPKRYVYTEERGLRGVI